MTRTGIPSVFAVIAAAMAGCGGTAPIAPGAELLPAVERTHGTQHGGLTVVPEAVSPACRNGRAKLFDECSDQFELLDRARQLAKAQNKVVLVSYGAEWCKWCHVFVDEIAAAPETDALKAFVTRSFVIVHIDTHYAPNGGAVLRKTGAARAYDGGLPFFFSLNDEGRYAAHLINGRVQTGRDRFDRDTLLADLKLLQARARR